MFFFVGNVPPSSSDTSSQISLLNYSFFFYFTGYVAPALMTALNAVVGGGPQEL
jgi:hypothetical protein